MGSCQRMAYAILLRINAACGGWKKRRKTALPFSWKNRFAILLAIIRCGLRPQEKRKS